MHARLLASLLVFGAVACTGQVDELQALTTSRQGGSGSDPEGDGSGGSGSRRAGGHVLRIDTSSTQPYAGETATTWDVRGRVTASEGIGALQVAGRTVTPAASGEFSTSVPIRAGLNLVEITATDRASPAHARKGHRVLLSSNYIAEGALNPRAAALVLTDAILSSMVAPLAGRVASIDIASEIMRRRTLTDDDCVTRPTGARHGRPTLALRVTPEGALRLEVVVPGLRVDFAGTCSNFFLGTVNVRGNMTTDVVLATVLSAPPSDNCVVGLQHGPPSVELRGFDLDVSGGSSLLEMLAIAIVSEMREGNTAEALEAEMTAEASALLDSELRELTVFDAGSTLTLFDVPLRVGLCMTGLVSEGGVLRAYVGARVQGPGGRDEAPGAPALRGELPPPAPGALWLDANLVGQLLFGAWRAGALSRPDAQQIDGSLLALLAPSLRSHLPSGSRVDVSIEGELAPFVRAAEPPAADATAGEPAADLIVGLGDLQLILSGGDRELFRIGTLLELHLDLVPVEGGLKPEVTDVQARAWVLDEPVADVDDEVLEEAVTLQIRDAAASLLGDAVITLPDIGGVALQAAEVRAEPGGRYVRVTLR
ncbi:MAG: hypothetical protein NZ898_12560 [Myxococcota bacterium]|nr:hypothetical protein [Myxococcota bacterium]MDW8363500.1 hypothetical protein [Myxococcales bacterium]